MTDIVSPLHQDFTAFNPVDHQDFGYAVEDSETEISVTEASSGFSSNEDDDFSLLGEMDFGNDDLVEFEGTNENFTNAVATVEQPPCPQVFQSYRLQYPDGTVHDLSARLGPLACSVEEWTSYGLDQNAWYPFAQDAATCFDNQALTARLVHALTSSTAVSACWDHTTSAMTFLLPNYAKRSDAARRVKKFYAQGIELEPLVRSCKADADQGLWQRYLRISSRDAVGLMSSASRGDWRTISDFLEHYLTTTSEPHWTIYESNDGVTNVHFDAVANITQPLQPPHVPGWNGGLHLRGAKAVVEKYNRRSHHAGRSWSEDSGSDADKSSGAATTSEEDSDSSSGEESDHDDHHHHHHEEEEDDDNTYNSPGPREPLGSDLPDRGRHMCRAEGCTRYYRWPDYFCGPHGGGRCHYMHWVAGVEPCNKFHQSKNSKGELLCGKHSRSINARYGEEKRKPKAVRNGSSKAATKAKKKGSNKITKKKAHGKTSGRR